MSFRCVLRCSSIILARSSTGQEEVASSCDCKFDDMVCRGKKAGTRQQVRREADACFCTPEFVPFLLLLVRKQQHQQAHQQNNTLQDHHGFHLTTMSCDCHVIREEISWYHVIPFFAGVKKGITRPYHDTNKIPVSTRIFGVNT